jgi:hypothetical protein
MILGITIFGFLAGSLASYFVEQEEDSRIDEKFGELDARLARIENALTGLAAIQGKDHEARTNEVATSSEHQP